MELNELNEFIDQEYGLGNTEIVLVRESSDNDIYKLTTDKGAYIARISKRSELQESDLMFELQLMRKSLDSGLKVPAIIPTLSKKEFTQYEGKYLVLFDFVSGSHLELSLDAPPTLIASYNAGNELGKMHSAWNNIRLSKSKSRTMYTEYERFLSHSDFFSSTFTNGSEIVSSVTNILSTIKSYNDEVSLIHNDFRPHNVFFDIHTQEVACVLDFDWSCRGSHIKDLAHSIVEWSFMDGANDVRLDVAQSFLDGYLHAHNIEIDLHKLKNWMVFACISDALTYWVDRKESLVPRKELLSYMYEKGKRALSGEFDSLIITKDLPYLYLDGLRKLALDLHGNERIHIGIRPYGFHAGNALTLTSYPRILCEEFKSANKEPNFEFIISINDWEQDMLNGPDYRKYPFNIYPDNTSIQMLPSAEDESIKMTDYWEPIIMKTVKFSLREFPEVKISFFRNSSLKNTDSFKELLLESISDPMQQFNIYKKYSRHEFLSSPVTFAGVVCPSCSSAHGYTNVVRGLILWKCLKCNNSYENKYEEFDYWWYHKMLLVARMKHFNFDVLLSGGDHFSENDYMIRKALFNKYLPTFIMPKMFFGATLVSNIDNKRMSKSKKNTTFVKIEELYECAKITEGSELKLDSSIAMDISSHEYKKYSDSL